jgi:hypothetical protein
MTGSRKVLFAVTLPVIFIMIFPSTLTLGLPTMSFPLPSVAAVQESVTDEKEKSREKILGQGERTEKAAQLQEIVSKIIELPSVVRV